MGLTGLEPVTLRLSSACSNQLSYRPVAAASPRNFRFSIADFRFLFPGALRAHLLKSAIPNRKSKIKMSAFVPQSRDYGATASESSEVTPSEFTRRIGFQISLKPSRSIAI